MKYAGKNWRELDLIKIGILDHSWQFRTLFVSPTIIYRSERCISEMIEVDKRGSDQRIKIWTWNTRSTIAQCRCCSLINAGIILPDFLYRLDSL